MNEERREEKHLIQTVLWRRLDEPALEHFRLWNAADAWLLEGRVLTAMEGAPIEVSYDVVCNRAWETRAARVRLTRGASSRAAEFRRDEQGRWWQDGERLQGMDGLTDIDLGVTPATNTLPIRRLALEVGATADVAALWVRFPELTVERLPQRYTRLDEFRYRYESAGGAFVTELEVDELGVVVRYEGGWERVAVMAEDRNERPR